MVLVVQWFENKALRLAMAGSPLIFALAVAMFAYWFRYACLQVLSTRTESSCIARVAAVNGLSFLLVRSQLALGETSLDALRESLNRDYRLLLYLLRQARGGGYDSIEQWLLMGDHLILQCWYWCVRGFSEDQARKALEERSRILTWLAHEVGRTSTADGSPARQATIMSWHPKRRSSQQSTDSIKFAAKSPKSSWDRTTSSKAS
jgi:hypothetical protein